LLKSDIVVIGAELESFVAALRLANQGAKVRLLMPGAGSLHYSNGGVGVLSLPLTKQDTANQCPFEAIAQLDDLHPYKLLAAQSMKSSIAWFLDWTERHELPLVCEGRNVDALTTMGRVSSVYAIPRSLATASPLFADNTAIVAFEGHADFLPYLCASGMARRGARPIVLTIAPPAVGDSVRIARAFDNCEPSYFESIRSALPSNVRRVIFPAVLGLRRYAAAIELAEGTLGISVVEVPTLPPSVFGLRLYELVMKALKAAGITLHSDIRGLRGKLTNGVCELLVDEKGNEYSAEKFLAANGGILMGGLEVDSRGIIHEPVFDLDVHQTYPLNISDPARVPDALHRAGVLADRYLRPMLNGRPVSNVHVTGALLAHWNPIEEISNEGVAITTGCAAADFALERVVA
jgi:glycerol-3-phosphate dehydrogenase subunit B